jgi:hypothetical protein
VCITEPDPCVNYGGTYKRIGSNIRVCAQAGAWGSWDNGLITEGFKVCTTAQWASYAPAAMFSEYGMNGTDDPALWIDNASCGDAQNPAHREVHSSIMMSDASCYDGAMCCWQDFNVLRFAVCGP